MMSENNIGPAPNTMNPTSHGEAAAYPSNQAPRRAVRALLWSAAESPSPLSIWGLRGVLFADIGAAWNEDFRGVVRVDAVRFRDIKASYGIGARMRFGYFILRYDLAWPTDLYARRGPVSHFAIGAEF